jgi:ribonucleoside-diphosphate reductase alpha chain
VRQKLPDERHSITHKFSIAGHDGYITCGLYEDGSPGEIFVRMAKEGSTIAGLMDSFATAISLSLQHGVPLKLLIEKFKSTRFEPSGFTGNPEVPRTTSIMDYIFRWLDVKFVQPREAAAALDKANLNGPQLDLPKVAVLPALQGHTGAARTVVGQADTAEAKQAWVTESDAPACHECGAIMVRSGACHKCLNCGATSGCS